MAQGYLIYHPARQVYKVNGLTIFHDKFGNNEDPYLWNEKFLHTYCHITQLSNEIEQINFWISSLDYPNFTSLLCDCVFVISEKHYWANPNEILVTDPIIDSQSAFEHHYKWANPGYEQHFLKRRRRYTLKANPNKSFQPQTSSAQLIDILPFLINEGYSKDYLIKRIVAKIGSRPFKLEPNITPRLYSYLHINAAIKLTGNVLSNLHP